MVKNWNCNNQCFVKHFPYNLNEKIYVLEKKNFLFGRILFSRRETFLAKSDPASTILLMPWDYYFPLVSARLSSTQLNSAYLRLTQLDSAWLSLNQLDSAQFSSTQHNSNWSYWITLFLNRVCSLREANYCSNPFEIFIIYHLWRRFIFSNIYDFFWICNCNARSWLAELDNSLYHFRWVHSQTMLTDFLAFFWPPLFLCRLV